MKSDAERGEAALFRTQSLHSKLKKWKYLTQFDEAHNLQEEIREHLSAIQGILVFKSIFLTSIHILFEYIEANLFICSYTVSATPVRELWWEKNQKAGDARVILMSLETREIYRIVMKYFTFTIFLSKGQIKLVLFTVAVYNTYFFPLLVVLQFRSLLLHNRLREKNYSDLCL